MYNPKYVVNKQLDNNEINYPPMFFNGQEVPIKLLRLTQVFGIDTYIKFDDNNINRRIVYWTNDNVDEILYSLSKPKSRYTYFSYDTRVRRIPFVNPFESNINCQETKTETDHVDHFNFYNCHPYKYVYFLEFDNFIDSRNFLDTYLDVNYTLPYFEENNPYEFIYYITILGRPMNFFNMHVSSTIIYKIYNKLIYNFKPMLSNALATFSEETLAKLNGPYKYIYNNSIYKNNFLYSDTQPDLCYNLLGDYNYIWFGLIDNKKIRASDIKIQLSIKEEYIFWVVNKLLNHLDQIIANDIIAFKFFIQHAKYLGNYASKFPNEPDSAASLQFEKYVYNGTEYKRELVSPPIIVFYIAWDADIRNIIDLLYHILPDSQHLNHKKISNDIISRFNFRITENICMSIGGDNQDKNDITHPKFPTIYVDENIPREYREIIDIANNYVLTEEQCILFNQYTNKISGHDLLKYEHGTCSINNILSYKGIIGNKGSFYNIFNSYNLSDYYEKLYNNVEFNLFKQNIIVTSVRKPLSAGYKSEINQKKIIKRLSKKQKKQMLNKKNRVSKKYRH